MKSIFQTLFYVCAITLLAACSASKPLTLDMSLDKGANFNYEVTTANDLGFSMMGQDMSTTGELVTDYHFLVKEVAPTGITKVDFKMDKITLGQSVPMMGDFSYDSSKKDNDEQFDALDKLIGKTMTASFNRKGTITDLEGVSTLLNQALGKLKGGEQARQMLSTLIGEDAIKRSLSLLTGFSQGKALKVGDGWTVKTEETAGMSLLSERTYSIRERKDGKATIDVSGMAKTSPSAKPVELQGMKISYQLEGPVTGVIIVDEKTGWALSSDVQQDLKGKMILGGTPMGDLNLDAKAKIGVSAKRK